MVLGSLVIVFYKTPSDELFKKEFVVDDEYCQHELLK
jgi:hypothetical protein